MANGAACCIPRGDAGSPHSVAIHRNQKFDRVIERRSWRQNVAIYLRWTALRARPCPLLSNQLQQDTWCRSPDASLVSAIRRTGPLMSNVDAVLRPRSRAASVYEPVHAAGRWCWLTMVGFDASIACSRRLRLQRSPLRSMESSIEFDRLETWPLKSWFAGEA